MLIAGVTEGVFEMDTEGYVVGAQCFHICQLAFSSLYQKLATNCSWSFVYWVIILECIFVTS